MKLRSKQSKHSQDQCCLLRLRNQNGGQIAELGPALIVLLMVIFFPMLDLLYYCFASGAAWYLHEEEARIVSVTPPNNGVNVLFDGLQNIPALSAAEQQFYNCGLGKFLQLKDLKCTVIQSPDPAPADQTIITHSTISNKFFVQAMVTFPIPFFKDDQALNGKGLNFNYTSTVLQEERGLN